MRKKVGYNFAPILLLFLISLFLVFFVQHFAETNHILRKSGKVMQMSLLILSGVCLNYCITNRSRVFNALLTVFVITGAITVFVDLHSFSDIGDASKTTYVKLADYKACEWIKDNTPLDAVVQCKPDYASITATIGDPFFEYSLISMFAERRMAVGDSLHASIYQIGRKRQSEREGEIKEIFKTLDIDRSISLIEKYGIDYIYIGDTEQETYGAGILKFANAPNYFERVYSEGGVNIYKFMADREKVVIQK